MVAGRGAFAPDAPLPGTVFPTYQQVLLLLPASFSQMLISPKTYSDHPLNFLTLISTILFPQPLCKRCNSLTHLLLCSLTVPLL